MVGSVPEASTGQDGVRHGTGVGRWPAAWSWKRGASGRRVLPAAFLAWPALHRQRGDLRPSLKLWGLVPSPTDQAQWRGTDHRVLRPALKAPILQGAGGGPPLCRPLLPKERQAWASPLGGHCCAIAPPPRWPQWSPVVLGGPRWASQGGVEPGPELAVVLTPPHCSFSTGSWGGGRPTASPLLPPLTGPLGSPQLPPEAPRGPQDLQTPPHQPCGPASFGWFSPRQRGCRAR